MPPLEFFSSLKQNPHEMPKVHYKNVNTPNTPSNEAIVDDEKYTPTQDFANEINGPLDRCTCTLSEN